MNLKILIPGVVVGAALLTAAPAWAAPVIVTLTGNNESITDNAGVFGLGTGVITGQSFVETFVIDTAAIGFAAPTSTAVSSNSIANPNPPFAVSGTLTINGHSFTTLGSDSSSVNTTGDYQILTTDPEPGKQYVPGSDFYLDLSGPGLPTTVTQSLSMSLSGLSFISNTFIDQTSATGPDAAIGSLSPTTLSISAVPEPASWAMMIVGMGAVGFATRRRKSIDTTIRFA